MLNMKHYFSYVPQLQPLTSVVDLSTNQSKMITIPQPGSPHHVHFIKIDAPNNNRINVSLSSLNYEGKQNQFCHLGSVIAAEIVHDNFTEYTKECSSFNKPTKGLSKNYLSQTSSIYILTYWYPDISKVFTVFSVSISTCDHVIISKKIFDKMCASTRVAAPTQFSDRKPDKISLLHLPRNISTVKLFFRSHYKNVIFLLFQVLTKGCFVVSVPGAVNKCQLLIRADTIHQPFQITVSVLGYLFPFQNVNATGSHRCSAGKGVSEVKGLIHKSHTSSQHVRHKTRKQFVEFLAQISNTLPVVMHREIKYSSPAIQNHLRISLNFPKIDWGEGGLIDLRISVNGLLSRANPQIEVEDTFLSSHISQNVRLFCRSCGAFLIAFSFQVRSKADWTKNNVLNCSFRYLRFTFQNKAKQMLE